jgi:hypothetical protein
MMARSIVNYPAALHKVKQPMQSKYDPVFWISNLIDLHPLLPPGGSENRVA